VTDLLQAWSAGDEEAATQVLPLVYEALRHIAIREFRRERRDHTLQATVLVHEAYLRLCELHGLSWESRSHFFAFAAHLIRRILVDHARRKNRGKHGGRVYRVTLGEAEEVGSSRPPDLLALDEALSSLEVLDPRKAAVVELRFFGGLTLEETAAQLRVSPDTVSREWRRAKAWLYDELSRSGHRSAIP
jgi:RNA polymerase sigma factor (TIGR02999 family)